ncbi:MAG: MupG family TIM beta-alpha barrel fold protein [Erysipelotrichaceae bacterium]|nr:MupG family TIM beta-alpha barrel fold protein [Erysipelotrichaceae bacterium]
MRRLGISIYPEKSSVEEIINYIDKAHAIGASRLFSCLLSVNKEADEIKKDFLAIHHHAKELGFEIILDVSPKVFNLLGISYKDLSFFKELKADGIRLDQGFSGAEEALMTYNPENLKIEINMSNETHTIDTIMDYCPNRYQLYGCHNFYPHNYSGLNFDLFDRCTHNFKKYGLNTASFIGCAKGFGPWPTTDGLVTLEMHRNLPLDVQLKHYIALDYIDDIIISNCFPSDEELLALSKVDLKVLNFKIKLIDNLPEVEKDIVLKELHFNRGDQNDYMIRSTQSRVKYKGHDFKVFNTPDKLRRGDIIIESSLYGHYAGELQIVLKDMDNSGRSNVVGSIDQEELFILDAIKPWQKFRFTL